MVRMVLMVRLRRLRSVLPHLLRTRVRRLLPTAVRPVQLRSTCLRTGRLVLLVRLVRLGDGRYWPAGPAGADG